MAGAPKLSICVPTYNRAVYLETLLANLLEHRPVSCHFELVISDNHSTDETTAVVEKWAARHPNLIYHRQNANVGATNNLLTAYRLASGEYALYLADDDRLTPGAVDEIVAFMDERPNVVAAHAPWEVWWVLDKGPVNLFYHVEADQVFDKPTAGLLFNFIINNHVFPEICIYRTAAMQRMMAIPHRAYWAFSHLANILDYGEVAFLSHPYYRHTVEHPGMPGRKLEGSTGVFEERDNYESGLEYLGHRCLQYSHEGMARVPESERVVVGAMVRSFMDRCLADAITQFELRQAGFEAAFEYRARLAARGQLTEHRIAQLNSEFVPDTCIDAFLRTLDGISTIDRVAIAGFLQPEVVLERFRRQRPGLRVDVVSAALPRADIGQTLVLAGPAIDVSQLVAAGYRPGFILWEADLDRRLRL